MLAVPTRKRVSDVQSAGDRWRYTQREIAVRLFVTCWLVYALHFATNIVREVYPAVTLGDHLSFDVSEYRELHPFDIFEVPGRGTFINNNPGASILGAIPYAFCRSIINLIAEKVQSGRSVASSEPTIEYRSIYPLAQEFYRKAWTKGLDVKLGLAAGVMQVLLMAPLSALSSVLMFRIFLGLKLSLRVALGLSLLYAFATPVFYRTAQLNQNILVSHFAFFAFAGLWRPWNSSWKPSWRAYLLSGLLAGWTLVLDYSGVVVVLSVGLYVLVFQMKGTGRTGIAGKMFWYGAGAAVSVSALLLYQWVAFGHPLYPAQYYMPPTTYTGFGFRGFDWPRLDLLWETAFGMRFGIFTSAPILLLALYPGAWFRSHRIVDLPEVRFIFVFSILFFLFCAANQYGRMQFNSGVRHVVPVTPFLFFVVAGVLLRLPAVLAGIVGVVAVYWSWCLAMYRDVEQGLGVLESIIHVTLEGFRFPWMTTLNNMGYLPSSTLSMPLLVLLGALLWVIWNAGLYRGKTSAPQT